MLSLESWLETQNASVLNDIETTTSDNNRGPLCELLRCAGRELEVRPSLESSPQLSQVDSGWYKVGVLVGGLWTSGISGLLFHHL